MKSQDRPILGVLELDEGLSPDTPAMLPREGALLNPATFGRPILTEMIEGASAERVICGSPELEAACISAAQRLVARGAAVIVGDCGFLIRHQAAVAAAVDVPVVLSSLLLLPMLLRQLSLNAKLAVLTADSRHCGTELLALNDPEDLQRVVIGGIEGGEYVRNALARPFVRTELAQIETEVAACFQQLQLEHPEIAMILFECTGFPVVAQAIRRRTGLPVFDITDLCRLTLRATTGT